MEQGTVLGSRSRGPLMPRIMPEGTAALCGLAFGQRDRTINQYRMTRMVNRFRPDHSVIVAIIIPVIIVHRTQVVLVDFFANS
jgi:hypothetical protein